VAVDIRVLGSLQVSYGDDDVALGGRRQRLVLALLLQEVDRAVSVDRLIDGVWGEAPPETSRKTLQVYVSRLRKVLGDDVVIDATSSGYALHAAHESMDSVRFAGLVEEGRRFLQQGDAPAATAVLREALGLWRGVPWGDLADAPALRSDVTRLTEMRLAAVELRIEADLSLGRAATLIGELEELANGNPLRERLRALLMTALYLTGRQAEALRAFDDTRRLLAEELGIEPSVELQRLHQRVLRQDETLSCAPDEPPVQPRRPTETNNPYKGLRPFTENDAGEFFGRRALVQELVAAVAAHPLVTVVGPSGSGKSSVVRAGLVPALRAGRLPGSEGWIIATLVPGPHPFEELEAALLRAAPDGPAALREQMRGDDLDLLRSVLRVLPDEDAHLVVVIDQFEELFLLVEDDAVRERFLRNLVEAVEDPHSRLTVVALVRVDFLDRPMGHPRLGELVVEGMVSVLPLTPLELERACVSPAAEVGVLVEPGLAAELVTDVAEHPGALPLFQYALTELFEARSGETLTVEGYRRLGGLQGALARRAEATWAELGPHEQRIARQVFLRLVTIGEGSEDTRRRARRVELQRLETTGTAVSSVLDRFGRARLLLFDRDAASGQPTVEVAHEALLREWPRLRGWVESARDELRLRRSLEAAMREWEQAGRDPDYLLTGNRLELVVSWQDESTIELTHDEAEFVRSSVERHDHEAATEQARQQHEIELERRSVRRLRILVGVLAVAALMATALTVFALDQGREATQARDEALVAAQLTRVRELTATAVANRYVDPQLSLLLTLHAANIDRLTGQPIAADTIAAMHWALQAAGIQYPVHDAPTAVLLGPEGPQGIFVLDLPDLTAHIQDRIDRQLTDPECAAYLATTSCPQVASPFLADIEWQDPTPVSQAGSSVLDGTKVRMAGTGYEQVGLAGALRTLKERTGVTVTFDREGIGGEGQLDALIEAGEVDIALIPQPSHVANLARSGKLMDLSAYLDVDDLKRDFSRHLIALGSVADDGTWPSGDGTVYAIPHLFSLKSMVWYPRQAFETAGYAAPTTWPELEALVDQMVADGRTPWCHGEGSRGPASGWPGTDWIEDLVLHEAGPDVFDAWVAHDIPFTDPHIRQAFERFEQLVLAPEHVFGGRKAAAATLFEFAQLPMFSEPPGCWLAHTASFSNQFFPLDAEAGVDIGAFPFPAVAAGGAGTVLGAGDMLVVLSDRPEVREVVRHLRSPEWAGSLISDGEWFFSMNRDFPLDTYPTQTARDIARSLLDSLESDNFRFDGSDLMPPEVYGAFWAAMVQFVGDDSTDLDALLAGLDEEWDQTETDNP
jgi:DNA-binding SARP family transcriptional activator/ABC-type glycerol-3-phosphate transport system substrate-binding protein